METFLKHVATSELSINIWSTTTDAQNILINDVRLQLFRIGFKNSPSIEKTLVSQKTLNIFSISPTEQNEHSNAKNNDLLYVFLFF